MAWRNSPTRFGLVTRLLHWGMALALLVMLAFGTRIAGMEPGLANLWMYGLHKSIGLLLLALVVLRLIWHRISPPPAPQGAPGDWTTRLARAAHVALYLLLLAIPLSGWVASSASGLDVMLFDRSRTLSLNLFEHVHGESRDRGGSMVSLIETYREGGFEPATSELPDHLPVLLEFLVEH